MYYHIGIDGKLEGEWIPKVPIRLGTNEPKNQRICVSDNVGKCLVATGGAHDGTNKIYIYTPTTKFTPKEPHGVEDSDVTDEKWITEKVYMKLVASIRTEWSGWYLNEKNIGIERGIKIHLIKDIKVINRKLYKASDFKDVMQYYDKKYGLSDGKMSYKESLKKSNSKNYISEETCISNDINMYFSKL